MSPDNRNHDLDLLTQLCGELYRRELGVALIDARPLQVFALGLTEPPLVITVDGGHLFKWCESTHATNDPAGAAARIAEHVTTNAPEPSDAA